MRKTISSSSPRRKVVISETTRKKSNRFTPSSFLQCHSITRVLGFPPQYEVVTTPVVSDFVKELFLDRFVKEIVKPFLPTKKTTKKRQHRSETIGSTPQVNTGQYHVMVDGKLVKRRRISQGSESTTTKTTSVPNSQNDPNRGTWNKHIVVGTNQCLRLLENLYNVRSRENDNDSDAPAKSRRHSLSSENSENSSGTKNSFQKPSLVVITKDIYPPTMCCAVPVLAKSLGIPVVILPGKASLELGKALNAKRTSMLIFCCMDALGRENSFEKHTLESSRAIASFVSFVKDQIPKN